jgi:hypothetical protein
MDNRKSENMKNETSASPPRRAFFGQLLTAVGGGFIGGNVLQRMFGAPKRNSEKEESITVSIHPLAVPRSKEGSTSNVE